MTAARALADVLGEAADYHRPDCPDRVMRVLITSSRTWKDPRPIYAALDRIHADFPDMVLVSGACKQGGDAIAERWAALRGVPVERHPAEWRTFGRGAGFKRNAEMAAKVAAGLPLGRCIAAVDLCSKPGCDKPQPHGSHGAIHCGTAAIKAGIPTVPFGSGARELADLLVRDVAGG